MRTNKFYAVLATAALLAGLAIGYFTAGVIIGRTDRRALETAFQNGYQTAIKEAAGPTAGYSQTPGADMSIRFHAVVKSVSAETAVVEVVAETIEPPMALPAEVELLTGDTFRIIDFVTAATTADGVSGGTALGKAVVLTFDQLKPGYSVSVTSSGAVEPGAYSIEVAEITITSKEPVQPPTPLSESPLESSTDASRVEAPEVKPPNPDDMPPPPVVPPVPPPINE